MNDHLAEESLEFFPPCGPIRGWIDGEVSRATNLTYATAARFAPPVRANDHESVFLATEWAPGCPQNPVALLEQRLGYRTADLRFDEQCLRLSVTMPRDVRNDEALPVMVWLHGGSYVSGAGDLAFMDPAPLVAEQRVIVVTVTYRLGLFGYLGGAPGRPANLGVLDQLEALAWVHRNIGAFRGDPENVTLFGESAGADAVLMLLATREAAALVRRVIVQSAPVGGLSKGRVAMHERMLQATASLTENTPVEEVLAAERVAVEAAAGAGLGSAMPFGPQPGHDPLPAENEIADAWKRAAPGIDMLIGHTAEEARFFTQSIAALQKLGSVALIGGALQKAAMNALTSKVYRRPAEHIAEVFAAAGARVSSYVMTWSAPGNPLGAAHTIDLPMLFGDEAAWKEASLVEGATWDEMQQSARAVRQVWGNFARGRQPTAAASVPGTVELRAVQPTA